MSLEILLPREVSTADPALKLPDLQVDPRDVDPEGAFGVEGSSAVLERAGVFAP